MPLDLAQGNLRFQTKGKHIALSMVSEDGNKKTALDVGCREGAQTRWLESKGYRVVPIDIEARTQRALVVDANKKLPFRDESFDLVWSSEVLEHLDVPAETVSEFRRVLKKGGSIILTTPNSSAWYYVVFRAFGLQPKDVQRGDHKHFFSERDIRKIFPDAKVLGFFPYFPPRFTIKKGIGLLSPTFVVWEKRA